MRVPFDIAYSRMPEQPNSPEDEPPTRFVRRKHPRQRHSPCPFARLDAFDARSYYDDIGEGMDTCRG